jgi:hypothetical protein
MDDEFTGGLLFVGWLMMLAIFAFWHAAESNCQEKYNVFDCAWTQSPFTPVVPDPQE